MTGRRSLEPREAAATIGSVAVALFLVLQAGAASAATSIVPSIGAVAAWTDNIDLAPAGQAQSGELGDVEPGLSLVHDSAHEHAVLDYTLHALFFSGGQHEFLHSGNLLSSTQVIPDWFELDISGGRTQGVADPAAPADVEYLFPTANLANYTSGLVKPILRHAFRALRFEASYTRGLTDDGLAGSQSGLHYRSNERDGDFAVSSVDANARLTWTAEYQRQQDDYQSPYDLHFLYEQVHGEIGLLTLSTLRLIGRGGAESNPQNGISEGGLASPFWEAGIDWSTGPHNELRLLAGHRYFGRTYDGMWRHQSRLLSLQVSYSEQPTTQDALMLQEGLATSPVVQIPGTLGFARLSPDVFLDKSLNGAATLTGRLTEIGLSITSDERIYYAIGNSPLLVVPRRRVPPELGDAIIAASSLSFEDRERQVTLYATRQLGPLMSVKLSAGLGKVSLRGEGQAQYTTQQYSAVLTKHLGRRSSLYVRADHIRQYGQVAQYETNIVSLGFNVSFGNPAVQGAGNATSNGP